MLQTFELVNIRYVLPERLKKMRGILSGVEDSADEILNYILNK